MAWQTWGIPGQSPDLDVLVDVTNAPTSPTRTWTSISQHVRSINWTLSGRNDEFQRTSPGSLNIVLDNRGDTIVGLGLGKAQWVSVQARWSGTTYEMWGGIITSLPRAWPGGDATVTLEAADVLYLLRLIDLPLVYGGGLTFPAQSGGARISMILDVIGNAGSGSAFVLTGTIDDQSDMLDAVSAGEMQAGPNCLDYALQVEASDNGLLIGQPNRTVDYQGRHWRYLNSTSPVVTFGEGGSYCPYSDTVNYEDDDARLANAVTVTPKGGTPQTAQDTASIDEFFLRRNQSADRELLVDDPVTALSAAQWLLRRYKDPPPRIPALEVALNGLVQQGKAALLPTLLSLRNSQRVTWRRNAPTLITTDAYVEQISHEVRPGTSWMLKLQLSPHVDYSDDIGWILADAADGQLESTTILTY